MHIRKSILASTLAITMAISAGPASAFTASNYLRVNPVTTEIFEVVARFGAKPGDYWCAAAEYLLFTGVSKATLRIYVVRELGAAETANRKSAVQFSVVPPTDVDTTPGFTLTVQRVGENLSAALARSQCYNRGVRIIP